MVYPFMAANRSSQPELIAVGFLAIVVRPGVISELPFAAFLLQGEAPVVG